MPYPASPQTVPALAHKAQSAAAAVKAGKAPALKVTGRLRTAIEAMVFEGATRPEAAEIAGMQDKSLRSALTKSHVLAYLNEQMEVLRTGARPKALNRIINLVDKSGSDRVRLDAARYIDGMDRTVHQQGSQVNVQVNNRIELPGYVIDLSAYPANGAQQIDHLEQHGAKSLEDNEDVPDEG